MSMPMRRRSSPDFFKPFALPSPIAATPASASTATFARPASACSRPEGTVEETAGCCWLLPLASVARSPSLSVVARLESSPSVVGCSAVASSAAGGQDLRRIPSTNEPAWTIECSEAVTEAAAGVEVCNRRGDVKGTGEQRCQALNE
eukprot:scaffold37132_cov57-Phaeocystis_antarctica.AAC.1